jgi:hypothetical protein
VLASFSLANFKSYESAILPLAPLSVLVGANAAGKSNLIEAMQLLAWLASGRRLADLSAAMKSGEMAIRGSLADLPLDRRHPIALGCTLAPEPGAPELRLWIELKVDNGGPRIVGEELNASDTSEALPYYYRIDAPAHSHGSEVSVAYNNFARGGKKPHITCVDQQAMFTQLLTPARFEHPEASGRSPRQRSACSALSRRRYFSIRTPRKCAATRMSTSTRCAVMAATCRRRSSPCATAATRTLSSVPERGERWSGRCISPGP